VPDLDQGPEYSAETERRLLARRRARIGDQCQLAGRARAQDPTLPHQPGRDDCQPAGADQEERGQVCRH